MTQQIFLEKFYNKFHKSGTIQTKIISSNNFTYKGAIGLYKKVFNKRVNLSILDYGCGTGTISLFLAAQGNRVVGVDISKFAINLAKKSAKATELDHLVKFQTLKSWKPKENDHLFDIIISLEVIEHVSDDIELLQSFHKYLRNNGTLLLSTPTVNAPLYKLGLLENFDKEVGHVRRYNINELIEKMEHCGFKITLVEKTKGILRNSLYAFPKLGFIIRFIRGPLSELVSLIDKLTIPLFGESNVHIVAIKK